MASSANRPSTQAERRRVLPSCSNPARLAASRSTRSVLAPARLPAAQRSATLCYMEHVGVRELRQNLSVYLRRIAEGETLEVTDRGRPVALLSPLPGALSGAVARLAEQGRLVRRAIAGSASLPPPLPASSGVSLSELLDDARADKL